MGRAGAGRSGGGHRSSSGHRSSRSSSGHRVSSSRAGSGSRSSGSAFRRVGYGGMHRSHTVWRSYSRPHSIHIHTSSASSGSPAQQRRVLGLATKVMATIFGALILMFGIFFLFAMMATADVPKSSYARKKLSGTYWQNGCIVDELGWFSNISGTERQLQQFFDKTGVQPYIVLKAYDPSLVTDEQKEVYAQDWYEENIDNEYTFLYMYFAEENADYAVGYMAQVSGLQAGSVMDSEAVDIFWSYLDAGWYGDLSTDDLFVEVFTDTANRIMTKSTTIADLFGFSTILMIVMAGGIIIICIMTARRSHKAQEAAETERILKADLGQMAEDELLQKYEKKEDT